MFSASPSPSVINRDVQGGKADVDETSVTLLSQIFSEKPTEVQLFSYRGSEEGQWKHQLSGARVSVGM